MIRYDLIQELWDMPSEEVRETIAHCVGILTDRHGGQPAADVLDRCKTAVLFHIPTTEVVHGLDA